MPIADVTVVGETSAGLAQRLADALAASLGAPA